MLLRRNNKMMMMMMMMMMIIMLAVVSRVIDSLTQLSTTWPHASDTRVFHRFFKAENFVFS